MRARNAVFGPKMGIQNRGFRALHETPFSDQKEASKIGDSVFLNRQQATHRHRHVMACVCILVNPSCKYFTKIQTHRADNKQRIVIVMSLRAFVFW
jgi:hypothetical protein